MGSSDVRLNTERIEAALAAFRESLLSGRNLAIVYGGHDAAVDRERQLAAMYDALAADAAGSWNDTERLRTALQKLEATIQKALNEEAAFHDAPESMYQPSGSQLLDHVHHRIAKIVARALAASVPSPPAKATK